MDDTVSLVCGLALVVYAVMLAPVCVCVDKWMDNLEDDIVYTTRPRMQRKRRIY